MEGGHCLFPTNSRSHYYNSVIFPNTSGKIGLSAVFSDRSVDHESQYRRASVVRGSREILQILSHFQSTPILAHLHSANSVNARTLL